MAEDVPVNASESSFVLLLNAGAVGERGWVFRLANHLRRYANLPAVAPLAVAGRPVQDPAVRMQQVAEGPRGYRRLDRELRQRHAGELLEPAQVPGPDAVLLRGGISITDRLLTDWQQSRWPDADEKVPIAIAADVVVRFGERAKLFERFIEPVRAELRLLAEERVHELASWVQRAMPPGVRGKRDAGAAIPDRQGREIVASELPGPLRLANHYLNQGNVEHARALIERAKAQFADHPALPELASRAGMLTNGAPKSPEAGR